MVLYMFLMLAIVVFATQFVFCLYAKKLWIKLLPVGMGAVAAAICWALYFIGAFSHIHGGDFAAYIYGIVQLFMLAVAGMGWGVYGIVKLVQKRRKLFVM